ncbi:hypothetical protein [Sphingomonas sp. 28-63-12]|uniref:hypothetical protein n=1 Tax=Sphingomonas sp. 28-63-12 TaxID=1970434 RepID=UPI000BCD9FA2|nr:MAG: hypothetical protein B7Y47_15430 [Sphingomonas sp. 28-63-12]
MHSEAQQAMSVFATQLGSISAFFGGVAVAFLGLLIFANTRSRLMETTIGAFVTAAVCFIVSALAATILSVGMLPGASRDIANRAYLETSLGLMNAAFLLGIIALLGGIMASGWLRSRLTGYTTTAVGAVGLLAVLWLCIRVT